MITGRRYLLRGQEVTVLAQWATARADPALAAALPLVRTALTAPRNVLIRYPDGRTEVRPFRGLRRIPDQPDPEHRKELELMIDTADPADARTDADASAITQVTVSYEHPDNEP